MSNQELKICVVGLGYVGLPLAVEFAKKGVEVYGFDVKQKRVDELKAAHDSSDEVADADLAASKIEYSADPAIIKQANFLIVAVPTPIDQAKKPDLTLVESASKLVGENIQKGSIVVYESTVYPGVTEDICVPIIEKRSGLKCGVDFKIGYSPERMNPGDKEHSVDKIIKVVSGMDEESLNKIADVYGIVCAAGVFKAANIKTAEAAKVIENIQRDLNIALANELALIFHRLGINTQEVLEAASTKWNFHKYQPGLVGGHCLHKNQLLFLQNTGHMKIEPIGDYVKNLLNQGRASELTMGQAKVFVPKIPVNTLTFNVDQKRTELKPVLAFSSRREEELLEITTATNQKIKVSPMHPMMIVEQGEFLVKHAKDLTLDDHLPVIFDLPEELVGAGGEECRMWRKYFGNNKKFFLDQECQEKDNYLTVGIKSIEKLPGDIVYSLETQDNKTLVTDYGLVVHNCIGVDPYYLTYRAEEVGYSPEVILAGRRINDYMAEYTAELMIKGLALAGKKIKGARVLILGLTFKENVKDTRNSKIKDIIKKLQEYGCQIYGYDPLVEKDEAEKRFKVKYLASLNEAKNMDGVVLAVLHDKFKSLTLEHLKILMPENPVLVDVKSHFLKQKPQERGFVYRSL